MELHLEDYIGRRRDTQRERELASLLRQMPEHERFEYIQQAMRKHIVVGLQLANSCLRDRQSFLALLHQGLQRADASSIRNWLETVMPHLGFKRVMYELTQALQDTPEAVDMAMYWLPGMLPKDDVNVWNSYYKLRDNVREYKKQRKRSSVTRHDSRVKHLRLTQTYLPANKPAEYDKLTAKISNLRWHGGIGVFDLVEENQTNLISGVKFAAQNLSNTDTLVQGEVSTRTSGAVSQKNKRQKRESGKSLMDEVLI